MKNWLPLSAGLILACILLSSCDSDRPFANRVVGATSISPGYNTGKIPNSGSDPAKGQTRVEEDSSRQGAPDPFLDQLAEDTWTYLSSDWATANHLPWSWRSDSASLPGGDFANPAEIGLLAVSWLAAHDLAASWSPSWSETLTEVTAILNQLRAWQSASQPEQPHGPNAYDRSLFFQWYWISWNPPVAGADEGVNQLVPSIDNAWLALSLITIREYAEANSRTALAQLADEILTDMDFTLWYNASTHRFYLGTIQDPAGGTVADYYSNENRIVNFVARALNQLSPHEYQQSLDALVQESATYNGITVDRVAWDGSFFTYAAPALFIQEIDTVYGVNTIDTAAQAQITYASDNGYPAWGLSDSFDIGSGDYVQQGAPPVPSGNGTPVESRPGLVTPHASALALITSHMDDAVTNLQDIDTMFPCAYDSDYGFRDSVMVSKDDPDFGGCSDRFSGLNQEWIFLSITNAQTGFVWRYLYRDEGIQKAHNEMFNLSFLPIIGTSSK